MNDLTGHLTELPGGMQVRRLLPAAAARAVGPFVFFDHFGPVTLAPTLDSDVGGHPHIGLATVTYLFEGAMLHRDSLGSEQLIEPGAINWMHAGSGIVHSERTPPALRGQARAMHGLQLWVALPPGQTDTPPHFQHVPASDIPEQRAGGARLRVLVGEWAGLVSPVRTVWPTLYLAVDLEPGAALQLPALQAPYDQWAVYTPQGGLTLDGVPLPPQRMRLLNATDTPRLQAGAEGAQAVLVGGQTLPQLPRMWWNFVAYDRDALKAAARRWEQGGFAPIPGETSRVQAPAWRD